MFVKSLKRGWTSVGQNRSVHGGVELSRQWRSCHLPWQQQRGEWPRCLPLAIMYTALASAAVVGKTMIMTWRVFVSAETLILNGARSLELQAKEKKATAGSWRIGRINTDLLGGCIGVERCQSVGQIDSGPHTFVTELGERACRIETW